MSLEVSDNQLDLETELKQCGNQLVQLVAIFLGNKHRPFFIISPKLFTESIKPH